MHLNRPETEDQFPSEILPNYCTPCTINDIGNENIKDSPEETIPENELPSPQPAITDNRFEKPELKGQILLHEPTEKTLQTWELPLSSYVPPSIDSAVQLQKDLLFIHYEGHALRRKPRYRHKKHPESIDSKKGDNGKTPVSPTPPVLSDKVEIVRMTAQPKIIQSSDKTVGGEKPEPWSFSIPTMNQIKALFVEPKKSFESVVKPIRPFVLRLGDKLRSIAVVSGLPKTEIPQNKNHTISSDSLKSNKPKPSTPSDIIRNFFDYLGLPH